MKKYDCIVVGSGNAGMSAALNLILNNKKVLLVEKHNVPGGCATSFVRGRFEIEPSLHELCDVGPLNNKGEVRNLLESYGVNVEWNEVPDCFRIISSRENGEKIDVTMPSGKEAFIDKMEEYVKGSRESMENLFDLFEEVRNGIAYISSSNGKADSNVLREKYKNMLITGSYPTNKVFDALHIPKLCQEILGTYWSYLGVDLDHLAFIHYAAMVDKYVTRGAYIPSHTSHEISNAMVERFRELGGEILFNCDVEKFLFDDNKKLIGVRTNYGDIECKVALANINQDIVYGSMVPKEIVPERMKKLSNARGKKFGARMITAYFCLDKPASYFGIKDYSIFFSKSTDSHAEYENILKGYDKNEYAIFLCYNIVNKNASPDGTCIVSFTTFGSPDDYNNLDQKGYLDLKQKIAKKFLQIVKEKAGIDFTGHIEEMEIATPLTYARYLNSPEGSVYGHETRDEDGMMARMMSLSKDYLVDGLYTIGADGPRGDGYSACYIEGNLISRLALKKLNGGV